MKLNDYDLSGFRPGPVNGYPSRTAIDIDSEAVAQTTCDECGKRMTYVCYVSVVPPKQYRAFAVCINRKCQEAVEF